jgi:SagB-type dehydrogenase family enzyme
MRQKFFIFLLLIALSGGVAFAARTIELPQPSIVGKTSLEEAIFRRRSERTFQDKELPIEFISQLLWSAQGITDNTYGLRAAPSSGALYPLSLYLLKKDGVFRYLPDGHRLLQLSDQDIRPQLARASLGQDYIKEAPIDIVIAANFTITQAKYGARAFRYVCMETGHAAENIQLQATALGLGAVPVGAFWDDVVRNNLKLPDNQDPLYIIPIGHIQR